MSDQDAHLNFRASNELADQLRRIAANEQRSVGAMIRRLLAQALAKADPGSAASALSAAVASGEEAGGE